MSLKNTVDSVYLSKQFVAKRLAANYGAGAATIFTITGGLVLISGLLVYHDTTVAGATTITTTINGVAMDAGALTMAGLLGTITVIPLGGVAMVAPAASAPLPTLLGAAGFFFGQVAGPALGAVTGLIVTTFGGAAMGALEQVSFRCIYRKIDPEALIS